MAKLKKYPAYCRQSIVFDYKPPTNTRGQRWTVATSGGCPIPELLQAEPYQNSINLEPWLLAWGLSIAKALEWPGTWVLGHVADGKYILTQCGPDNPKGVVRK